MSTLCWWKAFHFVGERLQTHRAIVERDLPVCVFPGNGVLEPILVIALLKVVTRMCASRFRAGNGGMSNHDRLLRQICELKGRDQRDVPLQRGVIDRNALQWIAQVVQPLHSLLQGILTTKYAKARLHRFLHQRTNLAGLVAALAMASTVEARQRSLLRVTIYLTRRSSRLDQLGCAQRCRPSEDNEIEQAVGA